MHHKAWRTVKTLLHCPACRQTRFFVGIKGDHDGLFRCRVCGVVVRTDKRWWEKERS